MACAHCGAAAWGTELYCPGCGRAFIPDAVSPAGRPAAAVGTLARPALPAVARLASGSRSWAAAAHATALVGAVSGGLAAFVGPLIIWLLRRDDPFAAEHARQALNFNLSMLVYAAVGVVAGIAVSILTLGLALLVLLPLAAIAVLAYFVVSIVGAAAAAGGRPFTYPLALPLVR